MINKNKSDVNQKDLSHHFTLIVSNLLAILFLTYFVFAYMKSEINLLSDSTTTPKAVLGVSETIVNADEGDKNEYLPNTEKVLVPQNTIQSEVSYSDDMVRELDDKKGFKGRIVLVKENDTL
ncbi:MAG TPA: hypothetical protein ENK82_02495 [Campylobacterales bacterium]|nr:hypothetical protein [Campylobacterales bacterium]HHS92193.1 hypothetical protein [Campylobacterales bacterium]